MKRPLRTDDTAAFEAALARQADASQYHLRLFVSGLTARSACAIRNLREICEANLPGRYQLEVIDIYQHPELARSEQIMVTPTLVKQRPLPLRRMIGDLSDTGRVLAGLDIVAPKQHAA
jgi:circadian clock protein KaiB